MNKTKRSIVFSVVSLVLCVAMLAGSTFAWFTDSVTSVNNIIKTGNLDLKVLWTDDLEGGNWNDAEDSEAGPVFSYDNWEPGYTSIRYVKIVNAGSLAFKYSLNLIPDGDAGILGDVIDVYYVEDASSNITKLDGLTKAGVLNDVINKNISAGGVLLPKGETKTGFYTEEIVIAIALHMHEDAGNEYQNKSVGASFAIQLLATQYDYESDDLGDGYDQGSQWPNDVVVGGSSASAPVAPVDGKVPAGGLNLVSEDGEIGATIPEGVAVVSGTTNMTLTIGSVSKSEANITLDENEAALSIDVHVSGVAENNTVPMAIYRKELLPVGLNMGNYRFYHVEDGNTVEMVLLEDGATPVHNNYEYDPATGDVVLYLASFSEVAMVADTVNPWEGAYDDSWYDADATELTIANADQLATLSAIVGGMKFTVKEEVKQYDADSFASQTIKLVADINLGDKESENNPSIIFYPIGYYNSEGTYERTNTAITSGLRNFEGTFDGNGNTISNFYQNTWEMKGDHDWYDATLQYYRDGMGLFGRVYGGTVKNLTVDNFSSDGEIATTGVIAAYAEGATFTNIAITNCNPRVYNIGNGGIVGCVGWYAKEAGLKTTFTNITVDNSNKISALWGSYDVACGGIVGQYYPTSGQTSAGTPKNAGIHFENCHVSAVMDVYNDVCGNYQYYAYRYTGMMIGSVRENVTIDGHVYPKMDGITASGCTVHFGDWNDYYYCELVANTTASYTHDHQMSRLTQVASVDVENKTVTDLDGKTTSIPTSGRVNYVVVKAKDANGMWIHGDGHDYAECYHFVDGAVWNHEDAGYHNGENGEKFVDENGDGVGDLKEDKQLVYREFNQLFTGYGWGVTSKGLADFEGTIILDNVYEGEPVTKFESKFTGDFLYRVGNAVDSTVSVGTLFQAIDSSKYPIANSGVHVKVDAVYENQNVGGTFKANATDWTKGTIQFYGTGIVKVTIQDYIYCTPTTIILEVVDAVNATTATSATSNNVVLLGDISSGFTVSGRYTVYGNGFTLNYTGNGQYLNNGLKQGIVTVSENGTLDNLNIKASIYPASYMYYEEVKKGPSSVEGDKTRYHYQLSAVAASGNATISNCYIYGARNNIFVDTGDVTIKDTILECGMVSNVQIQSNSSHTVTLENITTIQYQTNPTMGDTSLVILGAGILVGPETTENPTIVLNGYFKQYNWVNADDQSVVSNTVAKAIIGGALGATDYNHTVNNKIASNLGIIYMNTNDAEVINSTALPYVMGDVSIKVDGVTINGKVCSLQGATEEQIYSDYANADKSTVNGYYTPQFSYSPDLGGQYVAEGGDEHCYREGDTIYVMFPISDAVTTLDISKLVNIQKYSGQDLNFQCFCTNPMGMMVSAPGGRLDISNAGNYTLRYEVTDTLFYDENGETVEKSVVYTWDVIISVSLKDVSVPNAEFKFDSSKQTMGYAKKSLFAGGNTQYLPFLAGLKIYDYNYGSETPYLRFDGDTDFNKIAAAEITGYTSANHVLINVTLTDGGIITVDTTARAVSGGATYTGTLQTNGNTLYYVNGGTTSATTTTWVISNYSFIGNNGVTVDSGSVTFANCENGSVPSSSFGTKINYTVSYEANKGKCGQAVSYATSVSSAVTLPTPTRSGYIFLGWYTAASGGTKVGGAGDSYTPSANITLYAQWISPFNVTYNANGGSCDTTSARYDGTALTLPAATRDGYWFIGWYDAATGGNKIGDAGATYNPLAEITLYAQWQEQIEYTVNYNANGGSCGTTSATYEGTALTLPMPDARTGYTFNGWYTAASGGAKIGDAGATYSPSADTTLYAQWTINSYTITVTTNNATVSGVTDGQQVEYGTSITITVTYTQSSSKKTTVNGNEVTLSNNQYTFTVTGDVTIEASSSGGCVTPDTLVTLADGSQKRIDALEGNEMLMVWDFYKGEYTSAPVGAIVSHGYDNVNKLTLNFANGSSVNTIRGHGFFDVSENKFVIIDEYNVSNYVGHEFVSYDADGNSVITVLESYSIESTYTEILTIVSAVHFNCILEGMLTLSPTDFEDSPAYLMPFEIGEDMKYDEAKMQADIEKYGQYTYEDFADYCTYEQFVGMNFANWKVAVGKGYITYEEIVYLITAYLN